MNQQTIFAFVRPKHVEDGLPLDMELISLSLPSRADGDDLARWLEDTTAELRRCTPRGTLTFPRRAPLSPTSEAVAVYGFTTEMWPVGLRRMTSLNDMRRWVAKDNSSVAPTLRRGALDELAGTDFFFIQTIDQHCTHVRECVPAAFLSEARRRQRSSVVQQRMIFDDPFDEKEPRGGQGTVVPVFIEDKGDGFKGREEKGEDDDADRGAKIKSFPMALRHACFAISAAVESVARGELTVEEHLDLVVDWLFDAERWGPAVVTPGLWSVFVMLITDRVRAAPALQHHDSDDDDLVLSCLSPLAALLSAAACASTKATPVVVSDKPSSRSKAVDEHGTRHVPRYSDPRGASVNFIEQASITTIDESDNTTISLSRYHSSAAAAMAKSKVSKLPVATASNAHLSRSDSLLLPTAGDLRPFEMESIAENSAMVKHEGGGGGGGGGGDDGGAGSDAKQVSRGRVLFSDMDSASVSDISTIDSHSIVAPQSEFVGSRKVRYEDFNDRSEKPQAATASVLCDCLCCDPLPTAATGSRRHQRNARDGLDSGVEMVYGLGGIRFWWVADFSGRFGEIQEAFRVGNASTPRSLVRRIAMGEAVKKVMKDALKEEEDDPVEKLKRKQSEMMVCSDKCCQVRGLEFQLSSAPTGDDDADDGQGGGGGRERRAPPLSEEAAAEATRKLLASNPLLAMQAGFNGGDVPSIDDSTESLGSKVELPKHAPDESGMRVDLVGTAVANGIVARIFFAEGPASLLSDDIAVATSTKEDGSDLLESGQQPQGAEIEGGSEPISRQHFVHWESFASAKQRSPWHGPFTTDGHCRRHLEETLDFRHLVFESAIKRPLLETLRRRRHTALRAADLAAASAVEEEQAAARHGEAAAEATEATAVAEAAAATVAQWGDEDARAALVIAEAAAATAAAAAYAAAQRLQGAQRMARQRAAAAGAAVERLSDRAAALRRQDAVLFDGSPSERSRRRGRVRCFRRVPKPPESMIEKRVFTPGNEVDSSAIGIATPSNSDPTEGPLVVEQWLQQIDNSSIESEGAAKYGRGYLDPSTCARLVHAMRAVGTTPDGNSNDLGGNHSAILEEEPLDVEDRCDIILDFAIELLRLDCLRNDQMLALLEAILDDDGMFEGGGDGKNQLTQTTQPVASSHRDFDFNRGNERGSLLDVRTAVAAASRTFGDEYDLDSNRHGRSQSNDNKVRTTSAATAWRRGEALLVACRLLVMGVGALLESSSNQPDARASREFENGATIHAVAAGRRDGVGGRGIGECAWYDACFDDEEDRLRQDELRELEEYDLLRASANETIYKGLWDVQEDDSDDDYGDGDDDDENAGGVEGHGDIEATTSNGQEKKNEGGGSSGSRSSGRRTRRDSTSSTSSRRSRSNRGLLSESSGTGMQRRGPPRLPALDARRVELQKKKREVAKNLPLQQWPALLPGFRIGASLGAGSSATSHPAMDEALQPGSSHANAPIAAIAATGSAAAFALDMEPLPTSGADQVSAPPASLNPVGRLLGRLFARAGPTELMNAGNGATNDDARSLVAAEAPLVHGENTDDTRRRAPSSLTPSFRSEEESRTAAPEATAASAVQSSIRFVMIARLYGWNLSVARGVVEQNNSTQLRSLQSSSVLLKVGSSENESTATHRDSKLGNHEKHDHHHHHHHHHSSSSSSVPQLPAIALGDEFTPVGTDCGSSAALPMHGFARGRFRTPPVGALDRDGDGAIAIAAAAAAASAATAHGGEDGDNGHCATWTCPATGKYMYRDDRSHHLRNNSFAARAYRATWIAALERVRHGGTRPSTATAPQPAKEEPVKPLKSTQARRLGLIIHRQGHIAFPDAIMALIDCEGDEALAFQRLEPFSLAQRRKSSSSNSSSSSSRNKVRRGENRKEGQEEEDEMGTDLPDGVSYRHDLHEAAIAVGHEAVHWANMKRIKKEWAKVLLAEEGDFQLGRGGGGFSPTEIIKEAPVELRRDECEAEALGRRLLPLHWR